MTAKSTNHTDLPLNKLRVSTAEGYLEVSYILPLALRFPLHTNTKTINK